MSDRFAVSIEIGGVLPQEALDELIDLVVGEVGLGREQWGSYCEDSEEAMGYIRGCIEAGKSLVFVDDQLAGGEFDELEEFCWTHGLMFLANCSGKYEAPANIRWWKPRMEEIVECVSTPEGEPVFPASEILEILNAEGTDNWRVEAVRELIRENKPPEVPPFEIAEATAQAPGA